MNLPIVVSSDDHYFHLRFAEQITQNGFNESFRNFDTLPFTKIAQGEHFLYYNFLFYFSLIPFTLITPLFLGIKLFAIFILALIGFLLFYFLKQIGIRYSFWWSLGFFVSIGIGTCWRLFLARPFVFSPLIVLLLILALYKRKSFWIFFLSFIYLFWHTATFMVPLIVILVYFIAYAFYEKKYLWKEVLLGLSGVLVSILVVLFIDSGFLTHLKDNLLGVLDSALNFSKTNLNIQVGVEVYPKNFFDILENNRLLLFLFLSSVVYFIFSFFREFRKEEIENKKEKVLILFFFFITVTFWSLITLVSNRFTDFFIFFSWIFTVLILSQIFQKISWQDFSIRGFFQKSILIALVFFSLNTFLQLKTTLTQSGSDPLALSEIGNYLNKNLEKNEIVYNTTWNWFPQLYYYAPQQSYVIGLEPRLFYAYDARLYWLWVNIQKGYICEIEECLKEDEVLIDLTQNKKNFDFWYKEQGDKIAKTVLNDFQSKYIISSADFSLLNNVLDNNKNFEKVLSSDNYLFIYKIKD
jgi:hypothetical protein